MLETDANYFNLQGSGIDNGQKEIDLKNKADVEVVSPSFRQS